MMGRGRKLLSINQSITGYFAYRSARQNIAQSTRASQMDGRRWCFSPKDQTLSCSMVMLVGKNIEHLETQRLELPVYRIVLDAYSRRKCHSSFSSTILHHRAI